MSIPAVCRVLLGLSLLSGAGLAQLQVQARARRIEIRVPQAPKPGLRLYAAPAHVSAAELRSRHRVSLEVPHRERLELGRHDAQGRDRLFHRFWLCQKLPDQPRRVLAQRFCQLEALPRRSFDLPRPRSIKGLQCIVDLDDALSLGIQHAALNINLPALLTQPDKTRLHHRVDGHKLAINAAYLQHFDRQIRKLTEAGVRVYLILLNYLPTDPGSSTPLIDPRTDRRRAPNRIGGFHLGTDKASATYRGLCGFLAERYSRPDRRFGLVQGYIVGNEVQSHWWWYNLGEQDAETVIRSYHRCLRMTDLAVRSQHEGLRVYASFDHFWARAHVPTQARRCMPGKLLVDRLTALSRAAGDFPWNLAFHPYPENLRDPRTWLDKSARHRFDTPRITFKNIEVLCAYLDQPSLHHAGAPRRVILSEQGFDVPAGEHGEALQAASFAYAYERIRQIQGIDAFILHRHVDHAHEGGLRLGIRARLPGSVSSPGARRQIYEVFKAAGTAEWPRARAFALPILGVDSWAAIRPLPVPRRPAEKSR